MLLKITYNFSWLLRQNSFRVPEFFVVLRRKNKFNWKEIILSVYLNQAMIYIVMGVTGCGKSTIGRMLADHLAMPFYDADDYHTHANVDKMSKGIPLTDEDRMPWLQHLAGKIVEWEQEGGAVLACSALKEKYRKVLQSVPADQMVWIYLEGSRELIQERIKARKGHFMPAKLIDSQFEALEKPAYGLHVDISKAPIVIVKQILAEL